MRHAQPEVLVFGPDVEPDAPELHTDLRNVARWLAATSDAASRLGRSHAELTEFERVPGRLAELEPMLRGFEAERHGPALERHVRALMKSLGSYSSIKIPIGTYLAERRAGPGESL